MRNVINRTLLILFMCLPAVVNGFSTSGLLPTSYDETPWMQSAVSIMRFGSFHSIQQRLKSIEENGGLPDWLLEYDKNLLDSAADDGIIITSGHLDTLGAWYWQLVKGYRRDICIIPMALIDQPWFLIQLKNNRQIHFGGIDIPWRSVEILAQKQSKTENLTIRSQSYSQQRIAVLNAVLNLAASSRPIYFSPALKTAFLEAQSQHLCQYGLLYDFDSNRSVGPEINIDETLQWMMQRDRFACMQRNRESSECDSLALHCATLCSNVLDELIKADRRSDYNVVSKHLSALLGHRILAPQ